MKVCGWLIGMGMVWIWSLLSELGSDSTAMEVLAGGGEDKREERGGGIGIGECIRG